MRILPKIFVSYLKLNLKIDNDLIAGEKVVQHGPFVMNTRQEIEQAFEDYQLGKNGFEKIKTWKSIEGNK